MSSSHSPHDLLLLLPLQKSSSCNCQYKLINKNNNYYYNNNNNNTNNSNVIYNNYNNINNKKPENILLWVLVVPLLISTTPTTSTKHNSSQTGQDPATQIQIQTSTTTVNTVNTTTTTRSIDVQQLKSIELLLRTLTGSLLIQQIILKNLINKLQILLLLLLHSAVHLNPFKDLYCLRKVDLVLEQTSNTRWWCSFPISPHKFTSNATTILKKSSSSAAYFVNQPEEAFKFRLLSITNDKTTLTPNKLSIKGFCHPSTTLHCHLQYLRISLQG
ncbi:hypothetical protein FF38_01613 [Lucilia cuprina]|uniref:Uncharacterized protein n=1 Tax=Lucilia cuprina TaxID=7375 RepID=A0A0L0CHA3_LUCCU|nr:hypothetical protein CVS40_2970 [Lucilia cuprina]KNC30864.1 hypothetical protein FF38_01613 [Lucilia cuprina]